MKLISTLELARTAIHAYGRPLEQAELAFHFDSGSRERAIDALGGFQNEDGGFGNCLEPDFRLRDSTPLATAIGLQTVVRLGGSDDHPMIAGAVRYLVEAYDLSVGGWILVPPQVSEVPRAPWWEYDPAAPKFRLNPGAEVVGLLHRFAGQVPAALLEESTRLAIEALEGQPDEMEPHDAQCAVALAMHLKGEDRRRVVAKMQRVLDAIVPKDPAAWSGYAPTPLWFAQGPDSLFATSFGDLLSADVDRALAGQGPDGGWHPVWSWGQFEDDWVVAEKEWTGIITLKNLLVLRAFARPL